jgi:hypothetical protein
MPLGHLIDVTPAGLLQCCLQQCLPFQTDDPTLVKDVRPAKAHPPLPARDRPRLIEMLAHALLRYDSGCQTMALGEHGHIQGEVFACLRTLQWLADMFPYLEMPLRAAIRAPDLKDLTVHQIGQWLHGAPRVLQAFMALPNAAYNNMDASWRAFARNPLDYALDRSRQTILGSTYPGSSHVEAAPLATLKNLLYTKRWPRALDHQLLVDVLLVRMRAAFRRYGPPEWKDAPIYAVLSAIFQCLGMEAIAVSPANIVQRLRRLTKAISVARNVPGPAEAPRP